ncbi:MAG: hypothetical protein K1X83_10300 [Oligoflexia bacterium]|nr:hypothetical protein [Oligoflexia bacterium]
MGRGVRYLVLLVTAICACAYEARACDLCAVYSSVESYKPSAGRVQSGLAEQFTEYGKIQSEGHHLHNEHHQRLSSSISQVYVSYDPIDRLSLQLTVPYLNRRFKRVEGGVVEQGTEAGLGDLSLVARLLAYQHSQAEFLFNLQVLGGVKLPTGDTDRLAEELEEESAMPDDGVVAEPVHSYMTRHAGHEHGEEQLASAVHGHDLALGSGSVDFPVGVGFLAEQGRAFLSGNLVYTVRTNGDHQYEYADDLAWDIGPAYYLYLSHTSSTALRAVLSGEHKGNDRGAGGKLATDTALNTLKLGPQLIVRVSDNLAAEIALEMPLDIDNSGTQTVQSYRLQTALTLTF